MLLPFQASPEQWPKDLTQGTLFLAEAVFHVGMARYPGEWAETEPMALSSAPDLPPALADATREQREQAHHLLEQLLLNYTPQRLSPLDYRPGLACYDGDVALPYTFTEKQWDRLTTHLFLYGNPNGQLRHRFETVMTSIAAGAAKGELPTFGVNIATGVPEPLPSTSWNARLQDIEPRFKFGRITPERPFAPDPLGTHHIFIDSDALMEFLGHLPVKKPPRKRSTEEKPEASPASAPEQTPRTPKTEAPEKEPLVPFAYSISDAARMAGIGKTKLYKEVKEGRLPLRKAGRKSLISRDDLMRWLGSKR